MQPRGDRNIDDDAEPRSTEREKLPGRLEASPACMESDVRNERAGPDRRWLEDGGIDEARKTRKAMAQSENDDVGLS